MGLARRVPNPKLEIGRNGLRAGFLEEVKPDPCLESLTVISQAEQAGGGGEGSEGEGGRLEVGQWPD